VFFAIQDLEVRKIHFDVDFPPGEIDLADDNLRQQGDIQAKGVVELLTHTLGEIRIKGHLKASIQSDCDRCLEPATYRFDEDLDLFFRPVDTSPEGEEVEIDEGEAEISFYEGEGIELEDVVREHILLLLPMQKVCREDCKGICPVCGQNRNVVACACEVKPADDRWAALKQAVQG
jgi:uncharacterized protein